MAKHTFNIGDKVTVLTRIMGGRFMIEGRATVRDWSDFDEQYFVAFDDNENGLCSRFVDPAAQDNPDIFVKRLNDTSH